MISLSVWALVFVAVSSLGTLLIFVFRQPVEENRFGSVPRKSSLPRILISGFQRALDLSGRSSREEFFWYLPVAIIVALVSWAAPTFLLYNLLFGAEIAELRPIYFYIWPGVIALWTAYISLSILAVTVRRLHDINRSGGWVLIGAGVGLLVLAFWLSRPSQQKSSHRRLDLGAPVTDTRR